MKILTVKSLCNDIYQLVMMKPENKEVSEKEQRDIKQFYVSMAFQKGIELNASENPSQFNLCFFQNYDE